jgi:hypothetical protein
MVGEPTRSRGAMVSGFRCAIAVISLLGAVTPAPAAGGWVLWARSCDFKSQPCSAAWRRLETFEAERWCRGARTNLINQALTPEGRERMEKAGTVIDYQCLAEGSEPSGSKGAR